MKSIANAIVASGLLLTVATSADIKNNQEIKTLQNYISSIEPVKNNTDNTKNKTIKKLDLTELEKKLSAEKQGFKSKSLNKSIGHKFLENEYLKDTRISDVNVSELYTSNISSGWKGGLFQVKVSYWDNTHVDIVRKVFYNDKLVVNDFYNEEGISIGKQFNAPLLSSMPYSKEYLLLKKDINKVSPNGENMVIFTNSQCVYCRQYVPAMLDFALENNMNLYVVNLSNEKDFNSEQLTEYIIALLMDSDLTEKEKVLLHQKIYRETYSTGGKELLDDFNSSIKLKTKITDDMIEKMNIKRLLEINNEMAKVLHIKETPTVYIDNVMFTDYGSK